ncbi:MAG: ROK family protein [Anaerocolumna sp.]
MTYYIMLDVGGTKIKTGILSKEGILLNDKISFYDSGSNRSKNEIFDNFADIIDNLILQIDDAQKQIAGIGMAFPGPFDYKNGVSKMIGLGKYDAIYGCDFKKELMESIQKTAAAKWLDKDLTFVFIHDVEAFAMGESNFGTALECQRVMYLCIGTGSGSSFTEDKKVLKLPADNFPENGWIYKTPFKDSIIDDYISGRGLQKISGKYFKEPVDGINLYNLAVSKEEGALLTFKEFGSYLTEAIVPFLKSFSPDCLVLGGQISKSFSFFGAELNQYCKEHQILLQLTKDTSGSILKGLFIQVRTDVTE